MAENVLGEFLKSRRALMSPLDIGRPESGHRRVPGLRRTEVADAASISVEYYIELEQGRGRKPSEQVLVALSRAFRLDRDERDYLFGLAGVAAPPSHGTSSHIDPALLDLLEKLAGTPAQVFSDLYEVIAQNDLALALLGDPPAGPGPQASVVFHWFINPEASRRRYPAGNHHVISESYVADLRASSGRRPSDSRLGNFIATMRKQSAEFAQIWDDAGVAVKRAGRHQVLHHSLGLVDLECTGMLSEDGTQRLVWYSPRVGTEAAHQLQLLSVIGNTRFATPARDHPEE